MILWTVSSILVSITLTIVSYLIGGIGFALRPIDQSFSALSLIMQFKPISYKNIQSNGMYHMILIIQCDIWKSSNSRINHNNNCKITNKKNNDKEDNKNDNANIVNNCECHHIDNNNINTDNTNVVFKNDSDENEPISIILNNAMFGKEITCLNCCDKNDNKSNDNNNSNNNNDSDNKNNDNVSIIQIQ